MIVKEGLPFVFGAAGLSLFVIVLAGGQGIWTLVLPLYVAFFFRNPRRLIPEGHDLIVSPADGRVIKVEEVEESRYLKRRVHKVSIFMSPMNVHVNRIPCSGRVTRIFYNPGKKFSAFKEKASLENEQNAVLMKTDKGPDLLFVQIAGFLARRIVCRLKEGEMVTRGEPFGLIRFGSRVDIYLPVDVAPLVKVGDRIKAGESVLARFS